MQQVWRDWPAPGDIAASVVTMGVFDGFHLGHTALVERTLDVASRRGLSTALLTFEPHPLAVLAPERAPVQLLSTDARVQQALALGVENVIVLPFTPELAELPARDFVSDLVEGTRLRSLVVGQNFRCGRGGEGDVELLRRLGRAHGFDVQAVDLVHREGRTCSSTEVRRALAAGDVDAASRMLGRPTVRPTHLA